MNFIEDFGARFNKYSFMGDHKNILIFFFFFALAVKICP